MEKASCPFLALPHVDADKQTNQSQQDHRKFDREAFVVALDLGLAPLADFSVADPPPQHIGKVNTHVTVADRFETANLLAVSNVAASSL